MLENWLMSQLNEDSNDYIFQQVGSPAHYKDVRGYLNRNLPQRWIGRIYVCVCIYIYIYIQGYS